MQASPIHVTLSGLPVHVVFTAPTPSPNKVAHSSIAVARSTASDQGVLSTTAEGCSENPKDDECFFVAVTAPAQDSEASTGPQLYHVEDSGACHHVHTLEKVLTCCPAAKQQCLLYACGAATFSKGAESNFSSVFDSAVQW